MSLLTRLPTVIHRELRAGTMQGYNRAFFSGDSLPNLWMSSLASSGVEVSPDLAMTLSAYFCAVSTIGCDLATLPPRAYRERADGGKTLVAPSLTSPGPDGIGLLSYRLRWLPNEYQTSAEFWTSMMAQFLMRSRCFAEIVPGSGPAGYLGAMLPRHPDRVKTEMLPSGRVRYRLQEQNGVRYVNQEDMFCVRDMNTGRLDASTRVDYAGQSLGTALATTKAAAKFFKTGMTAAAIATYQGEQDTEMEADLHASISRYAAGVENSFGLLLVPDNVKIENMAVEPEKAQMMQAQEWGVKEVARYFRIPLYKLGVTGSQAYASQVQSALDYVITCLRPTAVMFEQSIWRDLILNKETDFVEFPLDELLRGDPDARAQYYERAIRNRWMTPSEVRLRENMNPDEALDALSAGDFRPGSPGGQAEQAPGAQQAPPSPEAPEADTPPPPTPPSALALMRGFMAVRDNAGRCLRRERAALAKIAKRHASDPESWQKELREFYGDHAAFVAETMRVKTAEARGYVARHGSEFEANGIAVLLNDESAAAWEREEADDLAALAIQRS